MNNKSAKVINVNNTSLLYLVISILAHPTKY